MAPPTTIQPVEEAELYYVPEATPGTIPSSVGSVIPYLQFQPSDTPMWLDDESVQGAMGDVYGSYQGPLIAGFTCGGNFFGDTIPNFIWNLLGDYTASGTAASPASTTNAGVAAGALALPVASGGASFTSGMYVWIEDAGSPPASEVCAVGTGSTSTSVVLASPGTRFAHATATPFTNTTAPYTHVFSVLNGSTGTLNGAGQPPTGTFTHRTGLPANSAAQYAYACFSEIVLTVNAEGLITWTGKGVCAARVTAASAVGITSASSVSPYQGWHANLGVGGTVSGSPLKDFGELSVTMDRELKAYNTLQGSQQPYIIARGKQPNTGKLSVMPAIDESALTGMLANTQPQIQLIAANGLTGASLVSLQIDIGLGQYRTADLNGGSVLWGYDVPIKPIHTAAAITGAQGNSTTGASGGKGAVKITIQNAVPTYTA
jgi:hypothetical protein